MSSSYVQKLSGLIFLMSLCAGTLAKLHGVVYEPYSMDKSFCLGKKQVGKQLKAVKKIAKSIRLRTIAACPESTMQILDFADENKMGVLLGVYISGVPAADAKEFDMLKSILKLYPAALIDGIVVGDELVYDLGMTAKEVAAYIEKGKVIVKRSGLKIPVGTAEAWHILEFDPETEITAKVSDFLCMNMQPYWGGFSASCNGEGNCPDTGNLVLSKAEVLEVKYGKDVAICSTGWPTDGELCCSEDRIGSLDGYQAVPDPENAESFLKSLSSGAKKSGRPFYIGEAFDADWKRTHGPCSDCLGLTDEFGCGNKKKECEVVYHFGLHTSDGKKKNMSIP